MKVLTVIARILLALVFLIFGSNAILHFLPMPPMPPSLAADFSKVLMQSGYAACIGGFQILGALLLLMNRFVPLGLALLGAVIVNIWMFHLLMAHAPGEMAPAVVVSVLAIFLFARYRRAFAGLVHGQKLSVSAER